jgi:Mg2+ and Co2+ transporter CorA
MLGSKLIRQPRTGRRVIPVLREMVSETIDQALPAAIRLTGSPKGEENAVEAILPDFKRVRTALNELQSRVDRLTDVVASEISTEDSRRGLQENHNLARLTWLATTFIPLSYVTGFFSMTPDISELKTTYGWYFLTAIPLSVITMVIAGGVGRGWFTKENVKTMTGQKVKKQ